MTRYWKKKVATFDKVVIRSLAKAEMPFEARWKGVDAHENILPTQTGCMKLTMPLVFRVAHQEDLAVTEEH